MRRDRGAALRQQSVRALLAAPEDAELARRLSRRLPAAEKDRLVAALAERAARAGAGPAGYSAHLAPRAVAAGARPPGGGAATSFEQGRRVCPAAGCLAWPGARAGRRPAAGGGAGGVRAGGRGDRAHPLELSAGSGASWQRTVSPAREVAIRRRRLVEATPSARAALALARAMARRGRRSPGGRSCWTPGRGERASTSAKARPAQAERLALLQEAARLHEAAGQDDAAEGALLICLDLAGSDGIAALALTRQLAALALRTGRGEDTARLLGTPAAPGFAGRPARLGSGAGRAAGGAGGTGAGPGDLAAAGRIAAGRGGGAGAAGTAGPAGRAGAAFRSAGAPERARRWICCCRWWSGPTNAETSSARAIASIACCGPGADRGRR